MKPLRGAVWGCAVVLLGATAAPAPAAWDNVFQVSCFFHRPRATASYYQAPACCDPCPPQPVCTTRYVQRCYYQPVVRYETRSYCEKVTTYRTSYYYEPVTTVRYSNYFDPCTCRFQQVACPTTTLRLRVQCCPVDNWVQRCCTVPVTTQQLCCRWQPVTTCCTPAPVPACPPANGAGLPGQDYLAPPGVTEPRIPATPGVNEPSQNGRERLPYDRYIPPQDTMPRAPGTSYRQLPPGRSVPLRQNVPVNPPPTVRLERIVAAPGAEIRGQVVRDDMAPLAGARVMFVSTDRREPRSTVDTDAAGQFRVTLTSGGWLVYLQPADGKPIFQRRIEVRDNQPHEIQLVSR